MIQAVTVLIKNVFILLIFVGDLREKGRWLKGIYAMYAMLENN